MFEAIAVLVLRLICLKPVPLLHREIYHIRMVLEQLITSMFGTILESLCDAMDYVFPAREPLDLLGVAIVHANGTAVAKREIGIMRTLNRHRQATPAPRKRDSR